VPAVDYRAGHTVDAYGTALVPAANAAEPLAMHDSAERKANELRKDAMDKCATSDWAGCLRDLQDARAIDPDSEIAPKKAPAPR